MVFALNGFSVRWLLINTGPLALRSFLRCAIASAADWHAQCAATATVDEPARPAAQCLSSANRSGLGSVLADTGHVREHRHAASAALEHHVPNLASASGYLAISLLPPLLDSWSFRFRLLTVHT